VKAQPFVRLMPTKISNLHRQLPSSLAGARRCGNYQGPLKPRAAQRKEQQRVHSGSGQEQQRCRRSQWPRPRPDSRPHDYASKRQERPSGSRPGPGVASKSSRPRAPGSEAANRSGRAVMDRGENDILCYLSFFFAIFH
jgi:hypothetical protein